MPLELQKAVFHLILQLTGGTITSETPAWLKRPGKLECGARWPLVRGIYKKLTGLELIGEMPPRESRRVDGILRCVGSSPRIVEFDESQHFNRYRGVTFSEYPAELRLAFDREAWVLRSKDEPRQKSGGWAKPKPPLFDGAGGRHRQRAFRDALADILPPDRGFEPTLRIADFEVKPWIHSADAPERLRELLERKLQSGYPSKLREAGTPPVVDHSGSSFDSFLDGEGILEEVEAAAIKRVIAWQLAAAMQAGKISKKTMAERMGTSRSQLDRLLDPENSAVHLQTIAKAVRVLGKRLRFEMVDAA
jgi:DNA-binding Xre family transcriptional regulator